MFTLAHAHGTALALVNIVAALTARNVGSFELRPAVSFSLIWAGVLFPLGFFLGGIVTYGGDPGLGIHLTPTVDGRLLVGPNARRVSGPDQYQTDLTPASVFHAAVQPFLPALRVNGLWPAHVGIRDVVAEVGDAVVVQADLCLDEFTDHGHCGVLDADGRVDNDATLEVYGRMAVAQADAGAHLLGLSGMMDGQVAAVRAALDAAGHTDTAVLAYAAKYASAFYGPFREAVQSTLTRDRRTYQLDPANRREGVREALLDVAEGADVVMVKPAMAYLDVLADVAAASPVPVWAYQVSGEYAMVEAAAAHGWIDRRRAIEETVLGIRRAGADAVLTYWASELAAWLREGL